MKKLEENKVEPRFVGISGLQQYVNLGRNSADILAQKAGAKKRVGKRVVYDLEAIGNYLAENSRVWVE